MQHLQRLHVALECASLLCSACRAASLWDSKERHLVTAYKRLSLRRKHLVVALMVQKIHAYKRKDGEAQNLEQEKLSTGKRVVRLVENVSEAHHEPCIFLTCHAMSMAVVLGHTSPLPTGVSLRISSFEAAIQTKHVDRQSQLSRHI
ncbi:hypothetical protein VOLCADRAFT_87968 [Volvox carteri f. nagariensis]|uniref:Secreted protein n=1 Tax=Volvox carteri f. nagariensis TaxID=3068 RepID=D8TMQ8_VOLCA|nr:uncharacterized protein VOLCADRAFT_87968 [Volvox carteri f. nagariensis]EFJ51169.1 hypothetical protein VOLCADRAFT_87968 [Volvox carteri f. nagariensis]|eukprot:XP_002947636.1 hypothetical protein VOLCADRAFT_87968 [Volvox carteri f. nagariensis]